MVAADGRFNRIRQVAPMCRSMRAHWRHLANTIELVLPSIRPCTPSTTQTQIDQFSRFCIAHGRKSLHFTWDAPPPSKLPIPVGIWTPEIHTVPAPIPESSTQTASRSVQPFLHGLTNVTDRPTDHATRSVTIGLGHIVYSVGLRT